MLRAQVCCINHNYRFRVYFQVHMKEVMSAVWLNGLDVSYLREQVGGSLKGTRVVIECFSGMTPRYYDPIRPWGNRWWGRWSETTVSRSCRAVRCTEKLCSPLLNPEVTRSVSSLSEERIASESRSSPCSPSAFLFGRATWNSSVRLGTKKPHSASLSSLIWCYCYSYTDSFTAFLCFICIALCKWCSASLGTLKKIKNTTALSHSPDSRITDMQME